MTTTTPTMMREDDDLERNSDEPLLEKSVHDDKKLANKFSWSKVARTILIMFVFVFVIVSLGVIISLCCCSSTTPAYAIPSLQVESTTSATTTSSVAGPIPPFHPHHTGVISYSSHMKADESVDYRRDITAPCNYGMLLFSVGPAKNDLPYTYDIYDDAYLFSNNNELCIFYPQYRGYQVADHPFWEPEDPRTITIKNLNIHKFHRISSRIVKPSKSSEKKINPLVAGDYIIMGSQDFYNVHYFQELKATVQSWKEGDEETDIMESFVLLES